MALWNQTGRYPLKSEEAEPEKAYGAGLEDSGDNKLVMGRIKLGTAAGPFIPKSNPPFIPPQTLAEAVKIQPAPNAPVVLTTYVPVEQKKAVAATPATMDLTVAKLQDVVKQLKADFEQLSRFPEHNQGLAMNKLANAQFELEKIITSLESDI